MPFQSWPENIGAVGPEAVVKLYEQGFAGVRKNAAETAAFHKTIADAGGEIRGDIAGAALAGSAAGKLVTPFVFVEKIFPGCWPASAQERGDCVSHGTRNAALLSLACEIVTAKPDEVTGRVDGKPDVPEAGQKDGVLSTEYFYWWRGYNGDGWSCEAAADVAVKRGMMLRKPYPELDIDLTEYSGRLAGTYGSKSPPSKIEDVGNDHVVRTATELDSFEQVRDFLANGYGISSCGGEGFSSTRDENGYSPRRGSWAHAMAYIAADDRDEVKQKYGSPLVCILNSWGRWNSGPRRIMGTTLDIPEGAFWAKWSDISRRSMIAFSSLNGWPARKLPDAGFDPNILG
jgi:hypothetical protein